jgi:hypothetical protein
VNVAKLGITGIYLSGKRLGPNLEWLQGISYMERQRGERDRLG